MGLPTILKIGVGSYHCLALSENGEVFGWGDNTARQLGTEGVEGGYNPIKIKGIPHIVDISTAVNCSMALDRRGRVYLWGSVPGLGIESSRSIKIDKPLLMPDLEEIEAIACGGYHMIALTKSGKVYLWGDYMPLSLEGKGEEGYKQAFLKPILLDELGIVEKMAVGMGFSFFLNKEGVIFKHIPHSYENNYENEVKSPVRVDNLDLKIM